MSRSRNNTRTKVRSTTTTLTDRISREDSTLRGQYGAQAFEPVDGFLVTEESEAHELGWYVAVLSETPEDPGSRFHTPAWIKDLNFFRKFGSRLANVRKKEYPTLKEFQQSRTDVDCVVLFDYFVDHLSYEQIFRKHSRASHETDEAYGVYDVSTKDANSVAEAIEFAAQKNGTFSIFDEDDGDGYEFFDQIKRQFRKVTGRKINDKLFRVDFREQNDDKYFLPERLDPSTKESTRPLQRYIQDLVDEGYALLKIAQPTEADRKVAREFREDEKARVVARAQLGTGTNPKHWEKGVTRNERSQDTQVKSEYSRLLNREAKKIAEAEAKVTAGLNSFQLRKREQERGEAAFKKLMAATKADEAVANATRSWQPPVIEPEPAATPTPVPAPAPAVRHEVLRMSIQLSLATMTQGRPTPQFQGARL